MPRQPNRIRVDNKMNLVGPRVKHLRSTLQITQDQLGGRLSDITAGQWGPTVDDIYRIEAGTRMVADSELLALAVALECEAEVLLKGFTAVSSSSLAAQLFRNGAALPSDHS
jgi:transcriptional regulator with XRE-family HTH domain